MINKKIAVLPGDGIGPEVIREAIKCLDAIALKYSIQFEYSYALIGAAAIQKTESPLPKETIHICKNSDAILFGAIGDPAFDNNPQAKVRPEQGLLAIRKELELFANIRPINTYETLAHASPLKNETIKNVNFIVFRELTGGIYFGSPRGRTEDLKTAFDTCTYSEYEIIRIAELAFQESLKRKSKVTLVDKANVLATSRLWREVVTRLKNEKYHQVELETMFVDNAAMKIITNPTQFDVILTENMFGDILTDEASVITGSLGMLPSASIGEKYALYEPIHGSYPEAAGKQIANPIATILSAAMMLETSFQMVQEAHLIQQAVVKSIENGFVTKDINPHKYYTTSEIGSYIASNI